MVQTRSQRKKAAEMAKARSLNISHLPFFFMKTPNTQQVLSPSKIAHDVAEKFSNTCQHAPSPHVFANTRFTFDLVGARHPHSTPFLSSPQSVTPFFRVLFPKGCFKTMKNWEPETWTVSRLLPFPFAKTQHFPIGMGINLWIRFPYLWYSRRLWNVRCDGTQWISRPSMLWNVRRRRRN